MPTLQLSSATQAPSPPSTAAELLAAKWPALRTCWPNLHSVSAKQAAFLCLDQQEAFFGGAAGPGKSDALLAAALQYVDEPGYAAIVFRRTFSDLDLPGAAMDRAKSWLRPDVHWDEQGKTFTFPSGATLTFGYLEHEKDKYRYKSAEFQFIGFDELTQFSESQYEYLFTRLRSMGVRVPLRMRAASNPGDVGHGWVKRRFITERAPNVIFIPARLEDHPDEEFKRGYRQSLAKLDDVTRRQYEQGDWDAAAGLAFTLVRDAHLVPEMEIPEPWERFESMDFGVSNPTCVLAWAVDYDGNSVVFDEYYQAETLVSGHARAIEARRKLWHPDGAPPTCWADPSMWARNGRTTRWGDPATDVTEFHEHGVSGLVQANNKRRPGRSRVLELMKLDEDRLFPSWHPRAGEHGSPRLFFVADRCPEVVRQVADAPLLETESNLEGAGEIVKPEWETHHGHAVAALRYGAMSRPAPSPAPYVPLADPRAEYARRVSERRTNPARVSPAAYNV